MGNAVISRIFPPTFITHTGVEEAAGAVVETLGSGLSSSDKL